LSGEIRAQVIAEARSWIGTPYKHLAGAQPLKGVACDCVGLLRAVFDLVTGRKLEVPKGY
jgi:cell wall-associated NlpC family hydrolase